MNSTDITPGSIVVGVDGSEHSDQAVIWAVEQAALEGRPLVVVHAMDVGDVRTELVVAEQAAALARSQRPGVDVQDMPAIGEPRQVLRNWSENAHLLVVGSRGRGVLRSHLLGSVGASVAKHAHCPVVVVRPERPGLVKDGVLVGADGTAESVAVIEFAFRQASLHRLPLTVMHCTGDPGYGTAAEPDVHDLERLLAESVAGLSESFPDVHLTPVLARGRVADCLTGGPRPHHLVVVGHHSVHPLVELVSGATGPAVIERSHSTVAVVPESSAHRQPALS